MKFIASGLAAATLASAASADITITLNNQTFAGFNFNQIMDYANGQEAVGTLTALSINMTLNASTSFTYADDICIYVDPLPLGTGGRLQVGGFSNLQAAVRRTAHGAIAVAELLKKTRAPEVRAGAQCRWCPLADECATGTEYLRRLADPDDEA